MKVVFRVLVLLFGITGVGTSASFAQSGWTRQTSGTTNGLDAVSFVDAKTGWAGFTGIDGLYYILNTTDGGDTWTPQLIGRTSDLGLHAVVFVDANTGWAVGGQPTAPFMGVVVHTTDGGATWTPQDSGTPYPLLGVCFVDANTGWAVGYQTIVHTTDGGATWQRQPGGYGFLLGIFFVDANTGWAVGPGILHTSDGGATWISQFGLFGITGVSFVDANTGWAVGYRGTILHTTTGSE